MNRFHRLFMLRPHPRRATAHLAAPRPDARSIPDLVNAALGQLAAVNSRVAGVRQRLRPGAPLDRAALAAELDEIARDVDAAGAQLHAVRAAAEAPRE